MRYLQPFASRCLVLFAFLFLLASPSGWAFEKIEYSATIRADIGGRHLDQDIQVRSSKSGFRIADARWPHRTLLGVHGDSKNRSAMVLDGSLLQAPLVLPAGRLTKPSQIHLPPADECAVVLGSAVGMYAFINIADTQHHRGNTQHRKRGRIKDLSVLLEPGTGRSAHFVFQKKKERLELWIAPGREKYAPLPSPRRKP